MHGSLTPHFRLIEFTRSATADRHHLCNEPPIDAISNLQHLCQTVLEPLRLYHGEPVIVSSGYRCRKVNLLVGGVRNSQHMKGEAADICPSEVTIATMMEAEDLTYSEARCAILQDWMEWIRTHCDYDQLIFEQAGTTYWLHVSCKRNCPNRQQVASPLAPLP